MILFSIYFIWLKEEKIFVPFKFCNSILLLNKKNRSFFLSMKKDYFFKLLKIVKNFSKIELLIVLCTYIKN
jgi:hypothetical protein